MIESEFPAEAAPSWKRISSRPAYDGFAKIRRDVYRQPDGSHSEWDVLATRDSVAVVAITRDSRVVVFSQFRVGPARVISEVPGGYLEEGESPVSAAMRELAEETGYSAEHYVYAGSEWHAAHSTRRKHLVFATGARRTQSPQRDPNETGLVALLGKNQFSALVRDGDLTDAGTIARGMLCLQAGDMPGLAAVRDLFGLSHQETP